MIKKHWLLLLIPAFAACNLDNPSDHKHHKAYFDLEGYFKKEIARLQKANLVVNKTVITNGQAERKSLKIKNWKQELGIFVDADINKTSWNGSFNVTKTDSVQRFISDNKKIKVKQVEIASAGSKIKRIEIWIAVKNILYTSTDTLVYFPDSLYEIRKQQKIRLLSQKNYTVLGKLK